MNYGIQMIAKNSHIVIFSHGFGVRKEDRGLFTAVYRALPNTDAVMFDYNPIHEKSNTLTAKPLHEQAQKLRKVINDTSCTREATGYTQSCHANPANRC
jgi:hypothetical protein